MAVLYASNDVGEDPDQWEPDSKEAQLASNEVLRVNHLLISAPRNGICVEEKVCASERIADFLGAKCSGGETGAVIALVDSTLLQCTNCSHLHCLKNIFRPCNACLRSGIEFAGHFILLTDYEPETDTFVYQDPAHDTGNCRLSSGLLSACRTILTDFDVLFVQWDSEMLNAHMKRLGTKEQIDRVIPNETPAVGFRDACWTLFVCAKDEKLAMLLVLLTTCISAGLQIYQPILSGDAVNGLIDGNRAYVMLLLYIMAGVQVIVLPIQMLNAYFSTKLANAAVGNIREGLLNNLLVQEMGFFDDHKIGDLISVMTADAIGIDSILTSLPEMLGSFGILVAAIISLGLFDWQLMMICVMPSPLIAIVNLYAGEVVQGFAYHMELFYSECTKGDSY